MRMRNLERDKEADSFENNFGWTCSWYNGAKAERNRREKFLLSARLPAKDILVKRYRRGQNVAIFFPKDVPDPLTQCAARP